MSNISLHTKPRLYCSLLRSSVLRECKKVSKKVENCVLPFLICSYVVFLLNVVPGPHREVVAM